MVWCEQGQEGLEVLRLRFKIEAGKCRKCLQKPSKKEIIDRLINVDVAQLNSHAPITISVTHQ